MDYEKKDFRKLYEDLVKSDWFKRAYHNKSLGECPFDIPELAKSEDERIRKELKEAFEAYDIESTWNGIPIRSIFAWLEKQKEQKPAWSEEDEKMLRTIISDGSRGVELDSKQISFLKSLRPSWKPSEEQMSMLLAVVNDPNNAGSESCHLSLESLYNDLKKLM